VCLSIERPACLPCPDWPLLPGILVDDGRHHDAGPQQAALLRASTKSRIRIPVMKTTQTLAEESPSLSHSHRDRMPSQTKSYSRQLVRTGNTPPLAPKRLLSERSSWLPPDRNALIIDVGCAWGALLLELRQLGYRNLIGIEGDGELAVDARQRCGD